MWAIALTTNIVSAMSWSFQNKNHIHTAFSCPPSAPRRKKNHHNNLVHMQGPLLPSSPSINACNNVNPMFMARNEDDTYSSPSQQCPGIIFPGGGLFFYWQAGVIVSRQKIVLLCISDLSALQKSYT